MLMAVQWRGVFPAAPTQFHQDQAIDIKSTLAHLDTMIDAGIHGLIMLGTVGENCSLEYSEKLELLKATVAHVADRVPVLSGVAPDRVSVEGSGGRCVMCGRLLQAEEQPWHIHHRIWRSRGGGGTYDNLELLHAHCHRQIHCKGNR
jgi:hypothetical protein